MTVIGYGLMEVAQIISAIFAPVFTGALAYLYLKMVRVQRQQTKILARQEGLMEADHKPVILVGEIEYENEGQDHLLIQIANEGNGLIKDLQVFSQLDVRESKSVDDTTKTEGRLDEIQFKSLFIKSFSGPMWRTGKLGYSGPGDVVEPGEDMYFESYPKVMLSTDGGKSYRSISIGKCLNRLHDAGSEHATVFLHVQYEDMAGNTYREKILGSGIDLEQDMSLKKVGEEGSPTSTVTVIGPKTRKQRLMDLIKRYAPVSNE